ncbi:MAG: Gfo/Idh/MocA family oxidoreductase [Candidatus Omnitrophica bacterium]|nr:Gfo/Idh/MocA family oxidoreductase [Candidatus Omnitrophota bacterium]
MKKILKAGVIGCGRIGFAFDSDKKRKHIASHIGAYNIAKKVKLVAVCDLDKSKAESVCRKIKNLKVYTDVNKMLKEQQIDIVSICTPADTHYQLISSVAKFRPKAIFCEKPLATTVLEAAKSVVLCRKHNIILQIGHQRRFDRLHNQLANLIREKKLGEVQQANFYYTAGIINTGSHMFDLLCFFFGRPEWIRAFTSGALSYKKDDPNLDGIVKFSKGPLVTFQACDVKKYLVFELNCFLEKARLILKDSGSSLEFYEAKPSPFFSGYKELKKSTSPCNSRYKRDFMVNAVNHLVSCIKKKKQPVSSGQDGLLAVKLINAALASARNNGRCIKLS